MGIFSKIKSAGKSILGGIKKGFKAVGKAVGKFMNSKLGKVVMIALAVFTAGTALIAAGAAYSTAAAGGASLMNSLVVGGKAFLAALASPVSTAKGLAGGAAQTGAAAGTATGAAASTSEAMAAADASAAATQAGAAGAGVAGAGAPATAAAETLGAGTASTAAAAPATAAAAAPSAGGFLANAAKSVAGSVGKFAQTPAGLQLMGNAAMGYAQGAQQEEILKQQQQAEEQRDAAWRDPAKLDQIYSAVKDVPVPKGYLDRAKRVSEFFDRRLAPSYPMPGDQDVVAGYARGPV